MNWLYPNFLRRIDHYLKINYPHVWRTRVHDFGWFSLVLGNVVAILLGILVVGHDNVFSLKELMKINLGSKVLLIFVCLFWAVHLLRFKIKSLDTKTRLTTWLMYALCVGLLGLNTATFFSSIAYQTAQLYPDKVVQADYDYLQSNFRGKDQHYGRKNYPFYKGILEKEHLTKDVLNIMIRYDQYTISDEVHEYQVNAVYDRLIRLKSAQAYVQRPVIDNNGKYGERLIYHTLLEANWGQVMIILFFLPGLWLLLSVFRMRDVLISVFCTALIFKAINFFVPPITFFYVDYIHPRAFVCALIAFVLGMALSIKKYHLPNWNHIAGILVLMLGVTFFMALELVYGGSDTYFFLPMTGLLAGSMIAWLVSARLIDKRDATPFLR